MLHKKGLHFEQIPETNSYISQFPKNLWSVDLLFCTILQQNVTGSLLSAIDNLLIKTLGS